MHDLILNKDATSFDIENTLLKNYISYLINIFN